MVLEKVLFQSIYRSYLKQTRSDPYTYNLGHALDTECDPYIWNRQMGSLQVFETDTLLSNHESLVT